MRGADDATPFWNPAMFVDFWSIFQNATVVPGIDLLLFIEEGNGQRNRRLPAFSFPFLINTNVFVFPKTPSVSTTPRAGVFWLLLALKVRFWEPARTLMIPFLGAFSDAQSASAIRTGSEMFIQRGAAIQPAMSRMTSSATWPGTWYSAGRLGPVPAMKRWLSSG